MNPIEVLSSACAEMRELSDVLREAARGTVTDVSETMDEASSILTTILSSSVGSDPNENVAQDVAEFYEMAVQKEHEFKDKMEEKKDNLSVKINELNAQVEALQDKLDQKRKEHQEFLKDKAVEIRKENEKALAKEKARLKNEEKRVEEEKKARYEQFETFLAGKMSEVSQEYSRKLKDAESTLSNVNIELQTTVHSKHEEKRLLQDDLDTENRRMASEHERISREYQERKQANEQLAKDLDVNIARTRVIVEREEAAAQMKLKKMEQDFTNQKRQEINDAKKRIHGLENEQSKTKTLIEEMKFGLEKEKVEMAAKLQEKIDDKRKEMAKEAEVTKEEVERDRQATEAEYQAKYDAVNSDIEKVQHERKEQQAEISRVLFENVDRLEHEDREEREKHETGVGNLNRELDKAKKELKRVQQQKEQSLNDLKHMQQKKMGTALAEVEKNEKARMERINTLMRKFDEQQKKLTFLHQLTVEQLDKEKAEAILRLKKEHEMRKEMIILQVEARVREEIEREMAKAADVEAANHEDLLKDIQQRIDQVNSRIDVLKSKLDGLERTTQDKLDDLLADVDPSLAKELREIAMGKDTQDRGNELVSKLRNASMDVERRKEMVLNESNAISKNLDAMRSDFEMKMAKIEQDFAMNKQQLMGIQRSSEDKQETLNRKMDTQQKQLRDLSNNVQAKEREVDAFENGFESEKQRYEKDTKGSYEASLEHARSEPKSFQDEMVRFRDSMTLEMNKLKEQLDVAKANTDMITSLRMKERQDAFEEIETQFQLLAEERQRVIQEHHRERMEELHAKREHTRQKQSEQRQELEQDFNDIFDERKTEFEGKYQEYFMEKEELRKLNESLTKKLQEAESQECPKCVAKKEVLRRLVEKREDLKRMMGVHQWEIEASEEEMYNIFGTPKPKVAHDIIDMQKPMTSMSRKLLRPTLRPQSVLSLPGSTRPNPPRMSPFR